MLRPRILSVPGLQQYVPIGKHTLQNKMKKMSIQADLDQSFTNHSMRAYGVSKLFQASVPEKLIMERTCVCVCLCVCVCVCVCTCVYNRIWVVVLLISTYDDYWGLCNTYILY